MHGLTIFTLLGHFHFSFLFFTRQDEFIPIILLFQETWLLGEQGFPFFFPKEEEQTHASTQNKQK